MQFSLRILQGNWSELTGWALILAGLGLATWTLRDKGGPKRVLAVTNRAERPLPAAEPLRRIDPAAEWQRLMDIASDGLDGTEAIAASQARAREEIAAAEEMLAGCAAAFLPYEDMDLRGDRSLQRQPEPAPPMVRPLAA